AVGVFTMLNVPLNDGSATPAMTTCMFGANCSLVVRETVTRPVLSRVMSEMLLGIALSVSVTLTLFTGNFEVFVTVIVNVIWAGVAVTDVGPLMATDSVGRFAAVGVIAAEGADSALLPAMLVACTVKVDAAPFVRPPTSALSGVEPNAGGRTGTVPPVGTPLEITATV